MKDILNYTIKIIVVLVVQGAVISILWNLVIPDILGLPQITLSQGITLACLASAFVWGTIIVNKL